MPVNNITLQDAKARVRATLQAGGLVIVQEPHNDVPHGFSFAAEAIADNSNQPHSLFVEAPHEIKAAGTLSAYPNRIKDYFAGGVTDTETSALLINIASRESWDIACVDSWRGNGEWKSSEKRQKGIARRIIHHFNIGGRPGGIIPIGSAHVTGLRMGRNMIGGRRVARTISTLSNQIPDDQAINYQGYWGLGRYIAGRNLQMYKFTATGDYSHISAPNVSRDLHIQFVPRDRIFRARNLAI
ncbi:hypothetical protein ACJJIQ_11725 [Microbulbifer sp. ANSA003]|uniref:hypothetical protein n=1 Tax=Microbulbifer sp. ANSA003 TaxID=3243360 RepID=UPI00404305E8